MEVMKRNNEGSVELENVAMEIKIPRDRLALSILANNQFCHGADFRENGWVYINGEKSHKWFTKLYNDQTLDVNIWEPILKDVPTLENRYARMKDRYDKFFEEVFRPAFDKVVEVGRAHAKPTHQYREYQGKTWWLYTTHQYIKDQSSISFDWVEDQKNPENHEIGQTYYELDRKLRQYSRYKSKFKTALTESIKRMLAKMPPIKEDITLKLVINDKIFWYVSCRTHNFYEWKKVAWPEDQMQELIIV